MNGETDKPGIVQDTDAHVPGANVSYPHNEVASGGDGSEVLGGGSSGWRGGRFNKLALLAVVLLVGVAGTAYLLASHAETPAPDADAKPTYRAVLPNPPYVPDAVLLKFKAGVPQAVQDKLIARYGTVKKEIPQIGVKAITVPDEALDAVIDALSHNPAVEFAERDYKIQSLDTTPNDPEWGTEWGATITQTNKAWDTSTGLAQTVIADVDTGADFTLPDLSGKLLNTGYDFVHNDTDPTDDNGHGTAVSGVLGAVANNSIGVAGYCWGCMIMPVKVMDSNGGGTVDIAASGITYAADHGAKIVNMSFAATGTDRTLDSAIKYASSKGLSLYAAAGNAGSNTLIYPAANSAVMGVAGSTFGDALYSWSDYGTWVKIAAPGCNYTTVIGGGYGNFCGTSSATPAAAAIAGLLWSAKPTATASQVEQAIISTTDPCCNNQLAHGRINAYKAMQALLGTSTPADTTPPSSAIAAPANGTTVSGQTTVLVDATDNVAVTKVELYRNGVLYATSATSPYSFFWDTTTLPNGTYTLAAKAYDSAGNVGTSSNVSVTVSNTSTTSDTVAPVATITSPVNGATISGKVTVKASATDNVGVTEIDVYIDGVLKTASTSGSVSYNWNTNGKGAKAGQHTITVKAYDAAGNIGTATVTVTK